MANSMRAAWNHFGTPLMHLHSSDFINVIFGKTAITPSFSKLKTSNQTKIIQDVISSQPNTKISKFLCRNWQKKSLNTVTMVTKILTCYISVTVTDRPMVTIIHR